MASRGCLCWQCPIGIRSRLLLTAAAVSSVARVQALDAVGKALRLDNEGRTAFLQNQYSEAKTAFHNVLRTLDAVSGDKDGDLDAQRADLVVSARVHLGVVSHKQGKWDMSVEFFDAAHRVPGGLAFSFLRNRPAPYNDAQLPETLRWFVRLYAGNLHRAGRDDDARVLWEGAAKAGVTRDKWQCSLQQSPAEWELRLKPWWKLSEVKAAQKLAGSLKRDHKLIKEDVVNALVHHKAPEGTRLQLTPETEALRSGKWMELILFKNAQEMPAACAALPQLCDLVRPFKEHFHSTSGEVKLSHFTGATTGRPHCGPTDSRLRLHYALSVEPHRLAQMTVAGEPKNWTESKSLLFDDSLEHSVVFDAEAKANRIILIADFWHPDVPGTVTGLAPAPVTTTPKPPVTTTTTTTTTTTPAPAPVPVFDGDARNEQDVMEKLFDRAVEKLSDNRIAGDPAIKKYTDKMDSKMEQLISRFEGIVEQKATVMELKLKRMYDDRFKAQEDRIAHLEQQLRSSEL